jgi:nickel-type superoxide dismutase maturation protease
LFGRVAVAGNSMAPVLRDGDWVVVVPLVRPPRVGEIVVARDPRAPERLLLKRVARVKDGACTLLGDRPEESTDSRTFGPVARSLILGRAVFRYVPLARAGFL